jgi:hypothetical protein
VGVWEAVWLQAATEAAEGEGGWSGEGGAESVVAKRQRGVSAVMPVSGRRACFVVVEGCATPIKIGGVFPGVQRQRMGWRARRARIVGRTLTGRRVLRCLCGRLCHHAVNCLAVDCVRARACTNKAWQTVVCSASGGAHKRQACSGVGGGGGGAGGVVVLKCSRTDGVAVKQTCSEYTDVC